MATKRTHIRRHYEEGRTLGESFSEFIVEKRAYNLTEHSLQNHRETYARFKKFHCMTDETRLTVITKHHLLTWVDDMRKRGLSPHSINHDLAVFRTFLYWCMEREYMPEFRMSLVKAREAQLKLYTDEELLLLLEKPSKEDTFVEWRMWAVVNFVLGTGARMSTMCNVQIRDVDFNSKEIALQHTKNKKAQTVPLSPALEKSLREYMRIWRNGVALDDYLFPNVYGEKIDRDAFRASYARYCQQRGVSRTNIHGLRHNFAKGWVKNNENI